MKKFIFFLALTYVSSMIIPLDEIPLPEEKKTSETSKCPDCSLVDCMEPKVCKNGKTKDRCGCCNVCLRVEGGHCGGLGSMFGECGKNMMCKVRHKHTLRNRNLPHGSKIGRCEPELCKNIECGIHQFCKTDINGNVTCNTCDHIKCTHKPTLLECDFITGTEYANPCIRRKAECLKQERIVTFPSPCPKCNYKGQTYSNGEKVLLEETCEEAICRNGDFEPSSLNIECLHKSGFTCSFGSKLFDNINCANGSFCRITKTSKHHRDYPQLGECLKLDPDFCYFQRHKYKVNEKFINHDCSGNCHCSGMNNIACVSLCPPTFVHCKPDQTIVDYKVEMSTDPLCHCTRHICVDNTEICKQKANPGPCYGYMRRWFFNTELNKCTKFIYGGCRGNNNNFETKEECKRKCQITEVSPKKAAGNIPIRTEGFDVPVEMGIKFPVGGLAPETELSDINITISGRVVFPHTVGFITHPSCLHIKFEDISYADASSNLLSSINIDLSDSRVGDSIPYRLYSKKPVDLFGDYSMSAVLNVGWCKNKDSTSWIRSGDYLNDASHSVKLDKTNVTYTKDIQVVCYSCGKEQRVVNETKPLIPIDPVFDDVEIEGEGKFPNYRGAPPEGPKFSEKMMTIKGNINFPRTPGRVLSPSCLHIIFSDVSLMDAPYVTIATVNLDISNSYLKSQFNYIIDSKKPKEDEFWRTYTISAVLNMGWCPTNGSSEWIRKGDYLSDTVHHVKLDTSKDVYQRDIEVICYECKAVNKSEEFIVLPVEEMMNVTEMNVTVPIEVIYDNRAPKLGNKTMEIYGYMTFDKIPAKLPDGSCLTYAFEDITMADAPSILIASKTVDQLGEKVGKQYKFSLVFKKPIELDRMFSLVAVLNVGWCPEEGSEDWIRDGDYTTSIEHTVKLTNEVDSYFKWINLTYHCSSCQPKDVSICKESNKTYSNGESWKRDPCTTCKCEKGASMCMVAYCKPLVCDKPIHKSGQCCGECHHETCVEEGKTWSPHACIHCICFNGRASCSSTHCIPLKCTNPIYKPGQCCRECPPAIPTTPPRCFDRTMKRYFNEGESWKRDACTDCECNMGKALCSVSDCMRLNCENPIYKPGQCCPECPPAIPTALPRCFDKTMKRYYKEGEEWVEKDGCTRCTCQGGDSMCASPMCVFPECIDSDIINVPGVCCPICSNTKTCKDNSTNRVYVKGNTWQNDECTLCKCTATGIEYKEANTEIAGCKSVVWMNKYCGKICLTDDEKSAEPTTVSDDDESVSDP